MTRRRKNQSLRLTFALFGALVAAPKLAATQEVPSAPSVNLRGIRHVLYLAVGSDPNSRVLQQNSNELQTATLTVKIRISAHSQESSFYGDVPVTVSAFDPIKGSDERKVWQDNKCHHERGFPKMTVINVDGSIANRRKIIPVAARYRWIGLLLPGDEVMPSKRIAAGTDNIGSFITTRTETRQSRFFVDLKLYILSCDLPPVQLKREVKQSAVQRLSAY